jgi:hypothetical protein
MHGRGSTSTGTGYGVRRAACPFPLGRDTAGRRPRLTLARGVCPCGAVGGSLASERALPGRTGPTARHCWTPCMARDRQAVKKWSRRPAVVLAATTTSSHGGHSSSSPPPRPRPRTRLPAPHASSQQPAGQRGGALTVSYTCGTVHSCYAIYAQP